MAPGAKLLGTAKMFFFLNSRPNLLKKKDRAQIKIKMPSG